MSFNVGINTTNANRSVVCTKGGLVVSFLVCSFVQCPPSIVKKCKNVSNFYFEEF